MHRQKSSGAKNEAAAAFVISVVTDAASQGVLMEWVGAVNGSCREARKLITAAAGAATMAAADVGIAAIRAARGEMLVRLAELFHGYGDCGDTCTHGGGDRT